MPVRSPVFSVGTLVTVPAPDAFAFLADGMNQTYWALGSWDRRRVSDDVFAGTSLFDGTELFIRLVSHPDLLQVDFETGSAPDRLAHAVEARVVPGPTLGHDAGCCLVTLTRYRQAALDEAAWERTWHAFETEIQMIKGRLELGFR
jgi:hypothetical protein